MKSVKPCQASWLAGRVENVGTEKKKHVSASANCCVHPSTAGMVEGAACQGTEE